MRLFRFQYPRGGIFFPMSAIAIVKPILEDRANSKAGMPDYQNVETIAAILSMQDDRERLWFVLHCEIQMRFL